MRILITGANGLLGQKLVELITESGHELIATSKGTNRNLLVRGYQYEKLDITVKEDVENLLMRHKPDVVINTAGMTNVDQCETEQDECRALNVTAVDHLIKACKQTGSHLVHLSTDFIFDGEDGPYDEEATPNPLSFYGKSKLAGEGLILQSDINWSIARTVLVYGHVNKMSRTNIVLWVKDSLEVGKKLTIVDDQWRTPTFAEDLAKGCLLIAEKGAKGVYNISGNDLLTPYELSLITAEAFGLDVTLITQVDSSTFTQPAKRPPKTGFIIEKARKELGYVPHGFKESLNLLKAQLDIDKNG